ncbi:hypothetical protein Tco_1004980 [Tanacetum coccineum]|uniref:DUF8039 domain-containing protein n=1 Tax=Tanacetum coccineum TaxID=301880 RepID=A0ABQ5FFW8_9ASTR
MSKASDDIQERELYQLQQMQHKAKESCMKSFRLLQSHLQVLSYNDLKINGCFERAFATLFEQDVQTFTGIMLLNLDQLEKQLDKDEFQGDRSMAAFCVINKQFQMFIDSQFTWDYDSQMTEKYFAEYTGIEVKQFRETLLLHMGNVKKSLAERTRHKRQYDRRMNERQMQSRESKVVSSKALDASLVVTECSGTKSDEHITSSSSGTYITHAVDADIRPVNDQVPFAEVQLTAQHNVLANEQQHTDDQSKTKKSSAVHEKPNTPRSCLRWKPTGRIFKIAGLRWIPTRKMFTDNTTKVDSEPSNGSNDDITNSYEVDQTLNVSAVGINPLVHSFRALSTLRRSGLRTASAAAKPCQGDSSKFYLITGRIPTVSLVDIHPVNSSADEEGGTTVVRCDQNDASIRKEMQTGKLLNLWELRKRLDQSERILQVKIPNPKKMCRYYHKLWHLKKTTIIAEGTVYKSDGKIMLHNKALPKDCYKVSIDKSLVDAAFIPDVGSNGCTTVLDAVGGFVAWPKNQVVLDPKATPPSTIQMITGENKTAPKVQTKRKNVYVSSDAMQKEANKKRSQKALVY